MSYAEPQQDARKHLIGLTAVIVFHAVLIYGLANGLARKVVTVLKSPLSVNIVEEIKAEPPPPPPPPKVVVQPKVNNTPPPAYVPPVEVAVQAPAQNTIVATTHTPVPEAPPTPPAPPPVVAPPPTPAPAPAVSVAVACPNHVEVRSQVPYPAQAERLGITGEVLVEFIVGGGGEIKDISVVRSSNAIFNNAATSAVAKLRCIGQGRDVRVRVPFSFQQG